MRITWLDFAAVVFLTYGTFSAWLTYLARMDGYYFLYQMGITEVVWTSGVAIYFVATGRNKTIERTGCYIFMAGVIAFLIVVGVGLVNPMSSSV